jgi:hypothetical protein
MQNYQFVRLAETRELEMTQSVQSIRKIIGSNQGGYKNAHQ